VTGRLKGFVVTEEKAKVIIAATDEALRKYGEELAKLVDKGLAQVVGVSPEHLANWVIEPYRIEVQPAQCTCGVHATGGLHSDWCDVAMCEAHPTV
jgi:hypothetical protein